MLKVSPFYLEKHKSFIPKKISNIKTKKALFTDPIFSEGFGCDAQFLINTQIELIIPMNEKSK